MLSIMVPVFNEEESLIRLHEEIVEVCTEEMISYEIIFIDDGSTDSSWKVIREISEKNPQVSAIQFRRNFGKAAALTAAMRSAQGDILMMMDADLQDDPAEIPKFLEKLKEGFDVVNGWKKERHDPWHKVYPSRIYNAMIGRMTGLHLHDHNCGLKVFRAEVAEEIRIYGEMHRFISVLAYSKGFRVTELVVNHRERKFGHSKYGMKRFLRGFLDLLTVTFLTGFRQRPQHLLGAVGLFSFGIGSLGIFYLSMIWIFSNVFGVGDFGPIGSRPMLAYSIAAMLLGAQALSLGLLAELMVAYTGNEADTYSVKERIRRDNDFDDDSRIV
jgi:glycosyltransferase involved in cell wall biosynthesis